MRAFLVKGLGTLFAWTCCMFPVFGQTSFAISEYGGALAPIISNQSLSLRQAPKTTDVSVLIQNQVFSYRDNLYDNYRQKKPFIQYNGVYYAAIDSLYYQNIDLFGEALTLESLDRITPQGSQLTVSATLDTAKVVDKPLYINGTLSEAAPILYYKESFYLPLATHFEASAYLPVIMYHSITTVKEEENSLRISPEKFRKDLELIKDQGYTTIIPEELARYQKGEAPLPENPIMLTFDDGYLDNYTLAFPILKEMGMKAVFNIGVAGVGKKITTLDHFTWEQAREMEASGLVSIQSHTYDLHYLADTKDGVGYGVMPLTGETEEAYRTRLIEDFEKAEEAFIRELGKMPIMLTYPFGLYHPVSEAIAKERGYTMTVTTLEGVSPLESDAHLLKRINSPHSLSSMGLIQKIQTYTR